MTNGVEFEIMLKRKSLSKKYVAEYLGLSYSGLVKKIQNKSEFKASEIQALASLFGIKKDNEIFFASNVN